jgi:hypothetical protein
MGFAGGQVAQHGVQAIRGGVSMSGAFRGDERVRSRRHGA